MKDHGIFRFDSLPPLLFLALLRVLFTSLGICFHGTFLFIKIQAKLLDRTIGNALIVVVCYNITNALLSKIHRRNVKGTPVEH